MGELTKMKKYNGSFVRKDDDGDGERLFRVGYDWAFCELGVCSNYVWRWDRGNFVQEFSCQKQRNGVVEIMLDENKETKVSLPSFRSLQNLVWKVKYFDEDGAKTVITVDEFGPDTIQLTTGH